MEQGVLTSLVTVLSGAFRILLREIRQRLNKDVDVDVLNKKARVVAELVTRRMAKLALDDAMSTLGEYEDQALATQDRITALEEQLEGERNQLKAQQELVKRQQDVIRELQSPSSAAKEKAQLPADSLSRLPAELWVQIASFLSTAEIASLALTTKLMRQYFDGVWETLGGANKPEFLFMLDK